jgi:serine/threonine protein kinase
MAPEKFLEKPYDGQHADIFSVGGTLFFAYCGHAPFLTEAATKKSACDVLDEIADLILDGEVLFSRSVPAPIRNLILGLLAPTPSKRLESWERCHGV